MNKEYSTEVVDIQFCKVDADGNELLNEDGSVKLFTSSQSMDFSWVAEYALELDPSDLVELDANYLHRLMEMTIAQLRAKLLEQSIKGDR